MHPRCHSRGSVKKPIGSRYFALGVLFSALIGPQAVAAEPALSEDAALAIGLNREALLDVTEGGVAQAEGERERARRWPNPVLSYQREETEGAAGSLDEYGWLTQTFDISGRRSLRGRAAEHRVSAARAEGETLRVRQAAEIRERFYETLLAQERVRALRAWLEQGTRVAHIVEKRARAGDVSGYDTRRIEREQASAGVRLASGRAALNRVRERLRSLVGSESQHGEVWTTVQGTLLPADEPSPVATLLERVAERPDLRALHDAERAAELDGRAAGRWWLPDVTLGAGIKSAETRTNERLNGPFIVASIPLPVLDQDQADALQASGRRRVSRGEYQLALQAAEGDVRGLWAEAGELTQAVKTFRRSAIESSKRLTATAESAYEAGEMELLALLDAHRSALDAELEVLELEMNARRARINLARVIGDSL